MNHPVLEKIKQSKALSLTARIAPHLGELNELVMTRLITWRQVSVDLGVNYQSLQSARRRAVHMKEKWAKAGIKSALVNENPRGKSLTPQPTQNRKKLTDFSASNNANEKTLSGFPTLPDYED